MVYRLPTRRAFERRVPDARKRKSGDENTADKRNYFNRLMQVTISNTYLDANDGLCASFCIQPTVWSTIIMNRIGLKFRQEDYGFSILLNEARKDLFIQFLRRASLENEKNQCWSRLSFALSISKNDAYFVSYTGIPIGINPAFENLYFTNQEAHGRKLDDITLNKGRYVTVNTLSGVDNTQLLDLSGTQYEVTFDNQKQRVRVLNIAQEEVMCRTACIPEALWATCPMESIDCEKVDEYMAEHPEAKQKCRNSVYLDFALLPEDKYYIELVDPEQGSVIRSEVLYTSPYPQPLCFIDLLFCNPDGAQSGVYPVNHLFPTGGNETTINPPHYRLKFNQRFTFWNYYIVPQAVTGDLQELMIVSKPGTPTAEFFGPCIVVLVNGKKAYRFVSSKPLPLQQQSDYYLQLYGRTSAMSRPELLMERLPVANGQQVLPEAQSSACADLLNSLDPVADQPVACEVMIAALCEEGCDNKRKSNVHIEDGKVVPEQSRSIIKNFSEIYVNV